MSKISGVLNMLQYLSAGNKYSIKSLASLIEVSPRMIRVYKEELEKAGIYIDSIRGPYGGYVLNQNINIPKRFIEKESINVENKKILNTINRAIKEERKCIIEYFGKDKSITKRTIIPYNLVLFRNEWGVASFCELKNEIRHFYINRIKSIILL